MYNYCSLLSGLAVATTSTSLAWGCGQTSKSSQTMKRRWSALCAGRTSVLASCCWRRWRMWRGSSQLLKERSQTNTWEFAVTAVEAAPSLGCVISKSIAAFCQTKLLFYFFKHTLLFFRCTVCAHFYLCENCAEKGCHSEHPLASRKVS